MVVNVPWSSSLIEKIQSVKWLLSSGSEQSEAADAISRLESMDSKRVIESIDGSIKAAFL
jgi:hypothetical protein